MSNLTFTSLASSSKGNSYVVSDGETTLLLDCGLTIKELQKRLGYNLAGITACLVSHEHNDHAKAVSQLLKRGVPVYMSEGTAVAHKEDMSLAKIVKASVSFEIGKFWIYPFSTFHNTAEPLGWLIHDKRTDETLLFAIDTSNMNVIAKNLDYIAIECNFQNELLEDSYTPTLLTERIKKSHFELEKLICYLKKLDLSKVKKIWLMHLSRHHTNEIQILKRFSEEFPLINVEICPE